MFYPLNMCVLQIVFMIMIIMIQLLTGWMPFCHPTNSVGAFKGNSEVILHEINVL